jgi:O-antigen/teichoic acid export membrane protein
VGEGDFGLWAAGMPILTYVGLVDFGVLTIFQRDVAFALGEAGGDPQSIAALPSIVGKILRLVLLQMPVLLAGIAIAWLLLPRGWSALYVPLAVSLGCLVFTFPLRIYHALLGGLQDLRFLGILAIVAWGLASVASALFILAGWRLNALAVSWSLGQLVTYGACLFRARARFPAAVGVSLPAITRVEAAETLRKGFWVLISQVAVMLGAGADLLVIAAVLGPSAVTPYTITDRLVTMVNNLPFQILASAQPALSELSTHRAGGRIGDVCVALTRVVLLVSGLLATVVVVVDQGFVTRWVGPHEFGGRPLVLVLVADMLLTHWVAAIAYSLFAFGYERVISITGLCCQVVVVGASVILVRHLGSAGAPLASVVVRGSVALPVLLIATARATGGTVRGLLYSVFPWAWRLGLVMAAGVLAGRWWVPHSILALSAAGAAAALVYSLVMWPLAVSEPLGTYTRPRFAELRQRLARGTGAFR